MENNANLRRTSLAVLRKVKEADLLVTGGKVTVTIVVLAIEEEVSLPAVGAGTLNSVVAERIPFIRLVAAVSTGDNIRT